MINRHTYHDLTWIDLESPNAQEVRSLADEFNIHPLVADELLSKSAKSKVDFYGNTIYCILHFPAIKHTHRNEGSQEIDFVLGKKFLITTHYDTIDPLHKFSKIFEVNSITDRTNLGEHAGFLFYYMTKKLYGSMENELEVLRDRLERIEQNIFLGKERDMVIELSRVARDLLTIKRAFVLHGDVLESLRIASKKLYNEEFDLYLRDLIGEYTKIQNSLRSETESLEELRSTNDSLLTAKQNAVMKTLTIMAFIMLPCSFIAAVFSMRVNLPLIGSAYDFWYVVALMIGASIMVFTFFRYKKWLS